MKHSKKLLVSIIIILSVFLLSSFTLKKLVFDKYENYTEYISLNGTRQDVYNKLKVNDVRIKTRETGSVPFDVGDVSNKDGIDVSSSDNYVRTYDTIKYILEVNVGPNTEDNPNFNYDNFNGGVIKVRATLPKEDLNNPNLTWVKDNWMSEFKTNRYNTVIEATYVVKDNVSLVNALQELSFTLKVRGKTEVIDSMRFPKFEVWMEGNYNDNNKSSAKSFIKSDDKGDITITGKPSIDVATSFGEYLNYSDKLSINGKETGGRYVNLGYQVALNKDEKYDDFRGIAAPKNNVKLKIKLTYKYSKDGKWVPLTKDTPGAIDVVNGTRIIEYGKNGEAKPNYYPNSTEHIAGVRRYPYGDLGKYSSSDRRVIDSGNIVTNLVEDIIEVDVTNFKVTDAFPSFGFERVYDLSPDIGPIITGNVELFVPYYGPDLTKDCYTKLSIEVVGLTYTDYDDKTVTIVDDANKVYDKHTNNNSDTVRIKNYVSGNVNYWMNEEDEPYMQGSSETDRGLNNASIGLGEVRKIRGYMSIYDGPYEGGTDVYYKFNPKFYTIEPGPDGKYFDSVAYTELEIGDKIGDANLKMKFGILTSNPSVGLDNDKAIDDTPMKDFTWYDTKEEALKNGLVTAIKFEDPDLKGFTWKRGISFYVKAREDPSNVGKVGNIVMDTITYVEKDRSNPVIHVDYYVAPTYENGVITNSSSLNENGESYIIVNNRTSINLTSDKYNYNVLDNEIGMKVNVNVSVPVGAINKNITITNGIVNLHIPKYFTYVDGSSNLKPISVNVLSDGSTNVSWALADANLDRESFGYGFISFKVKINTSIPNNISPKFTATVANSGDGRDRDVFRTSSKVVNITNLLSMSLDKNINSKYIDAGDLINVTTNIHNNGDTNLGSKRMYEVIPSVSNKYGSVFNKDYDITIDKIDSAINLVNGGNTLSVGNKVNSSNSNIDIKINDSTKSDYSFSYSVDTKNFNIGDRLSFETVYDYLADKKLRSNKATFIVANRTIKGKYKILDEPNSKVDVTVKLLNESNEVIDSKVVSNNGEYVFTNLKKGKYYIEFVVPNNYKLDSKSTLVNNKSSLIDHTIKPTSDNVVYDINLELVRKKSNLKVYYSYEDNDRELILDKEVKVGDKYEVSNDKKVEDYYELLSIPNNRTGIVTEDNIEVVYNYTLKNYDINTYYYVENSEELVCPVNTNKVKYNSTYDTVPCSNVSKNYELIGNPQNKTGTVKGNTKVSYYYRLKSSKITVKYLEQDTDNFLTGDTIIDTYWGKEYSTSPSNNIMDAYELVVTPVNYKGIVDSDNIEVIYYYKKKDTKLTGTLEFVAPDTIDSLSNNVSYNIKFTGDIANYLGRSTNYDVRVVFSHYYDETKSKLDYGSSYSLDKHLDVNWRENNYKPPIGGVKPTGKSKFNFSRDLSISFLDLKPNDVIEATITASIELDDGTKLTKTSTIKTNVEIPSKIVVHHYKEGTTDKVVPDVISNGLVGKQYITKPSDDSSLILVKKPEKEDLTYDFNVQEVVYEYQVKLVKISTRHIGYGSITGTEEVPYGKTSTKDNIVIKPDPGYKVKKITINGIDVNKDCKNGCVLSAFANIVEDKDVIVEFIKNEELENPNTSSIGFKAIIVIIFILPILYLFIKYIKPRFIKL